MRWLAALILMLVGCASSANPVEIELSNHSNMPVTGVLEAGVLTQTITLWPHQTLKFSISREMMPDHVRFVIVNPK